MSNKAFSSATLAAASSTSEDGLPASQTSAEAGDFTTLFVSWNGPENELPGIEIAVQGAGGNWSDWLTLHQDHHVPTSPDQPVHFNPLLQPGTTYQIRTEHPDDAARVVVLPFDASRAALPGLLGTPDDDDPVELIDGFIISRAGWGANEDFRHEGQNPSNPIGWPPRYRKIERVIVHHTETEFGWDDPAAVVRSIYYYHAVVLGWTDIGYNFLIDTYGNVYEGRSGGPGVVGGHALEYNAGSLGVALIGSYVAAMPSQAAQDALVRLIQSRAPDVDPARATDWIDWAGVPNICGHGDVISTACPGADLYAVLPAVRGRLVGSTPVFFPAPVRLYDPKIISFKAGPALVDPEGLIEIRATITQNGREPLVSQSPEPGFVYNEGQDFDITGHPKVEGCFRLAVDLIGSGSLASSTPNPYRWGFGGTIQQGETREITGYIRVRDIGTRKLVPSVVREFVRYYDDDELIDAVHVVHPMVSRAPESIVAGGYYFAETGHNVPSAFYEYWQAHGGLNRFGFPLTEPFDELSETDGGTYLTQYFERGRFEYHPELEALNDAVKLGLLGAEVTVARAGEKAFQPIEPFESTGDTWYFPETRHSTSHRFLQSWLDQGGLETFGFPVSEKFEEMSWTDGKNHLVQYFERARFEYHPDDTWDKQVKLGHLGREILIDRGWLPGPGVED